MSEHDENTTDKTSPVPRVDHTRPIPAVRQDRPSEPFAQQGGPAPRPQGPAAPQPGHQPSAHAAPGSQAPAGQQPQHPSAQQQHQAPAYAPAQQSFGAPPQHPGQQLWQTPYPSASAPSITRQRRSSRASVPLAALLAAVLASGGTYALTANDNNGQPAAGNTTVVQANPADFADAGSVNWSATAAKISPSVVSITATNAGGSGGRGSGVVLDTQGNIVTNNHVVAGSQSLKVTLADNRTYDATIVGTDPSTDLAVIKLKNPPSGLKAVALGDDSKLVVGQPVMAVGNPLGLSGTVTTGIVSALNRPVSTQAESDSDQQGSDEVVTNAIQTSAAINPGNSGGALVDGSGRLIGINSSIASLSGSSGSSQSGNIGIGFAIPVTVVKNITGQLIKSGKAQHARMGVSARTGSVSIDGATVVGAQVETVEPGSGAASAGLRKGDVILSIDGESVESSTSLVGQVRERTVGQRVALSVVRGGKRINVTVTLGATPAS